jgi:hypothetical protein
MRFWGLNYANDCCSRMEYREGAQPIQLPDRVGSTGRDELRSANSSQPSTRFAPGLDFKEVCSDHDRTKGDMSLTVILTNYKRPENVRRLIQALSQQTVKPTLFVWDNSSEQDCDDPRIDWLIRSSQNAKCSPRWWMASHANTDFVLIHDDDLLPSHPMVLGHTLDAAIKIAPFAVGAAGVIVDSGSGYWLRAIRH